MTQPFNPGQFGMTQIAAAMGIPLQTKVRSMLKDDGPPPGTQKWFDHQMTLRQATYQAEQELIEEGGDGRDELPGMFETMTMLGRK